ncbi:response regulator transcription factor [Leifsonia sp. H3M29-4]|uniref:response regulator n=1 Tax=Salinibacterium metalliresistens TaxID=3031321 RepID=UPI0023DBC39B|nr:response regulator transcription factor [Salinibacterium metalliresistens]MDF1478440.1 response regulator transcription factor [Salinibacterium metalliresistens]
MSTLQSSAAIRLAHVDDHETVRLGFAHLIAGEADLELVASVATIAELLPRLGEVDLIVLDLQLSDGSSLNHNLNALAGGAARVLAFTGADNPANLRLASRAGVLGILRKSETREVILDALRRAGRGEGIVTTEWAAALDSDPHLSSAGLSPKEQEVLALYASGDKSSVVAYRAGLSAGTVAEYVRRIRHKYAMAGRPAHTKVDLYKRAVEDGILPQVE